MLDMSKEKDSFFKDWLWEVNGGEIDPKVKEFVQEIKDKKGVYEYDDKDKGWHGTLTFLCAISALWFAFNCSTSALLSISSALALNSAYFTSASTIFSYL